MKETTNGNTSHQENVSKLGELIKDIKIAMLTTVDAESNRLRSRPMGTQEIEFDGQLWFFASITSPKADEIEHYRQVNVSYAAPDKNRYVSVSGAAAIVRDRAKIKELWSPIYKIWFPNGVDDPDLCLLRIDVAQAEYWDSPSGPVNKLVGFVKALVTGDDESLGKNEKLTL